MKILITAFEPFGDIETNCTEMVLNEIMKNNSVDTLLLPVENSKCFSIFKKKVEKKSYDYILQLGQASKRDCISIERVALNVYDFPIEDNLGNKIFNERIIAEEENALFSTLPIHDIHKDLSLKSIKSEISNSAGTYICNEIFFKSLNYTKNTETRLGFIHLPIIKEQNCIKFTPKWNLSDLCLGVESIMDTCIKTLKS